MASNLLENLIAKAMNEKDNIFNEALEDWDLERLYKVLAEAKKSISPRSRQGLTNTEKLYLRGILCGYSPAEIARKFLKSTKGAEVYVCKTLYQYLKQIIDAPNEPVGNWRNICTWLENAGYKSKQNYKFQFDTSVLPKDATVKIVGIDFVENSSHTINIDVNIKLEFPPINVPISENIDQQNNGYN